MSHAVAAIRVCGVLSRSQYTSSKVVGWTHREETFSQEKINRFGLAELRKNKPYVGGVNSDSISNMYDATHGQYVETPNDEEQPAGRLGK